MIYVNEMALAIVKNGIMRTSFNAIALSSDLIPQTLPLIRATWPGVDLATWRSYVQFFSGQAAPKVSGVNGLCDGAGCYHGLYAYQLERDLLLGPVLAVHLFTATDITNSPRIVEALLDTAEARAFDSGGVAMRVRLCGRQAEMASKLRSLGLTADSGQFCKRVELRPRPN
jgi:hypothetical protein